MKTSKWLYFAALVLTCCVGGVVHAGEGVIRVKCEEGKVYIDGKTKDSWDCSKSVKAFVKNGRHKVEVKKEYGNGEYGHFEKTMAIDDGDIEEVEVTSLDRKKDETYLRQQEARAKQEEQKKREQSDWEEVRKEGIYSIQAYLKDNPTSTHAAEARSFIKTFKKYNFKVNSSTVTDRRTGLTWARNTNIAGDSMTEDKAMGWVKGLNYGGHADWRLPTRDELETLINYAVANGWTNESNDGHMPVDFFRRQGFRVEAGTYWCIKSEIDRSCLESVLGDGIGPMGSDGEHGYVWPVRGGK